MNKKEISDMVKCDLFERFRNGIESIKKCKFAESTQKHFIKLKIQSIIIERMIEFREDEEFQIEDYRKYVGAMMDFFVLYWLGFNSDEYEIYEDDLKDAFDFIFILTGYRKVNDENK